MLTGSPSLEYSKNWPGEFPFVSNIARFITYQKAREGPKTQGWKEAYWQEKAKHEKTLRQMAELKLGYTQGKYHDELRSSMYGQNTCNFQK